MLLRGPPWGPLQEPALSKLAKDPLILAAAELARQEHGEGSHHSIAWEAPGAGMRFDGEIW